MMIAQGANVQVATALAAPGGMAVVRGFIMALALLSALFVAERAEAQSNSAPVANADTKSFTEDAAGFTGNVLTDGTPDSAGEGDSGQSLSVTRYTAHDSDITVSPMNAGSSVTGTHGSLSIVANTGAYTYTLTLDGGANALDAGDRLTDVFVYEISDGVGASNSTATARLTIIINGANDVPTLAAASGADETVFESGEDGLHEGAVDANASGSFTHVDADADDTGFGSGSTIQGRVGSTGNAWVNGSAAMTIVGSETLAGTVLAGTYGGLYLNQDGSWQYRLDDEDSDTQALINGGPGTETFTFRIDDGSEVTDNTRYSSVVTVSITVTGNSDPPTTTPVAQTVADGSTLSFTAGAFGFADPDPDTGADGQFLEVIIRALPDSSMGTLQYNGSDITVGTRSLRGLASNVMLMDSLRGTVVTGGTRIPSGSLDDLVFTPADRAADYNATFEYWVRDNGRSGGVAPGGGLYSRSATMTISVTGVADGAPTVANMIADQTTYVGARFSFEVPANVFVDDGGVSNLNFTAAQMDGSDLPSWLTFTASSRTFSGTPPSAVTLNITVTASDGVHASVSDTFALTAGADSNNRPVARSDRNSGGEDDTSITGNVLTDGTADSDADSQTLTVTRYTAHDSDISMSPESAPTSVPGTYGALVITGSTGAYTYTLDSGAANALSAGATGVDVFTYEISDGSGTPSATATAQLTITLTGANDAPVLSGRPGADVGATELGEDALHEGAVDANAGGSFTYVDADSDDTGFGSGGTIQGSVGSSGTTWVPGSGATRTVGSEMLVGSVLTGTYGRLYLNRNGSWQYRLDDEDSDTQGLVNAVRGTDTFTFRIHDGGTVYSNVVTVNVSIRGNSDRPTTSPRTRTVMVGDTLSFAAADFGFADPDLDSGVDGQFQQVIIRALPDAATGGTLQYDSNDITVGEEAARPTRSGVTVSGPQSGIVVNGGTPIPMNMLGMLVFTPISSSVSYNTTFEYWVRDSGRTGGIGPSGGLYSRHGTMTVRVTAAGDAPTVSIANAGVPDSITEGQPITLRFVRSGNATAALRAYARFSSSSYNNIFELSFAAGSTTVNVGLNIPAGTLADHETATVQVLTMSEAASRTPAPGTYAVSVGTALARSVSLVSVPTVSIATTNFPSAITESGSGTITFTRSGGGSTALRAYFSVASTSFTSGNVFGVSFAAGSATATSTVSIPANTVTADETATVTVLTPTQAMSQSPAPGTYAVGTSTALTRSLTIANLSTVAISSTDFPTSITEGMSGTIAFTRTGSTAGALRAYFSVSSTTLTGTGALVFGVSFAASSNSATATVNIPVNVVATNETATVTVLARTDASSQSPAPGYYTADSTTNTFTVTNVAATTTATVSISGSGFPTGIAEGASGRITFMRTGSTSGTLQAYCRVSSASYAGDNILGVSFVAGSATATVTVDVPANIVTSDETATVTVLTPSQAASRSPVPGAYTVGAGAALARTFTIADVVVGSNNPPVVAAGIPDRTVPAATAFSYTFPANAFTDADGDTLSYSHAASGNPAWLSFNAGSRTFGGTPSSSDVSSTPVTVMVTARDGRGGSVVDSFALTVGAVTETAARAARNVANEEVLSELAQTLSLGAINTVRQRTSLLSSGSLQAQSSVNLDVSSLVDFALSKAGTSPLPQEKDEGTGFFNESQALNTASFVAGVTAPAVAADSLDLSLADIGKVNLATLGEGVVDSATGGTGSHGERVFRLWASAEHGEISSSPTTGLNFNSDTTTVSMGIERPVGEDKLFGLAVSWFRGEPEFRDSVLGSTGKSELEQWSLMPYAAYSFGPARVWGAFGFGTGDMEYSSTSMGVSRSTTSDMSSIMYAAGVEYEVGSFRALDLLGRVEAAGTRLRLDRAADGSYDAMNVNSTGLRGEMEVGVPMATEYGQFRPYATLGYRLDGGDGNTDSDAVEYGGGLSVSTIHLTAAASMRRQSVGDSRASYALELAYDWYHDGKGLNLNVQNNIGNVNSGIWAKDYNYDTSASSASLRNLMNVRAGYGIESTSWLLTPYVESDMYGSEVSRWVMGLSAGGSLGVMELTHTVRPAGTHSGGSDDQESWLQFGVDF